MNFPEVKIRQEPSNTQQFQVDQVRFLRDKNPDFTKEKFKSEYG